MYGYVAIVALLILIGVLVYFYFKNKKEDDKDPSPSSGGDVIIITDEGSTFETQTSGTETYIAMPHQKKCNGWRDPSWCGDITPSTEMNYVFDPVGGSLASNGDFETTFNYETNMCADGTRDCVYEEKFDENRKIIGITNSKGEDFIQKFIDDIYSGTVDFNVTRQMNGGEEPQNLKDFMKNMIRFDTTTGKLSMSVPNRTPPTMEIIPGNTADGDTGNPPVDGKIKMAVGQMIMFIIFYYYANDLPKPTIKLDLSSEETYGQVYQDMLDTRLPLIESPAPSTESDGELPVRGEGANVYTTPAQTREPRLTDGTVPTVLRQLSVSQAGGLRKTSEIEAVELSPTQTQLEEMAAEALKQLGPEVNMPQALASQ